MASIYGLSIKALKSFRGHEGETCWQGNLYLGNVKIGYWSQDPWCGPDTIDLDHHFSLAKLNAAIKARSTERIKAIERQWGFAPDYDIEYLASDLVLLSQDEKTCKRNLKKDCYTALVKVNDSVHIWSLPIASYHGMSDDEIHESLRKEIKAGIRGYQFEVHRDLSAFTQGENLIRLEDILKD